MKTLVFASTLFSLFADFFARLLADLDDFTDFIDLDEFLLSLSLCFISPRILKYLT